VSTRSIDRNVFYAKERLHHIKADYLGQFQELDSIYPSLTALKSGDKRLVFTKSSGEVSLSHPRFLPFFY